MNSNFKNKDDLFFLIPDFLEGNITDSEILKKIELKIKSDDTFRQEINDIRTSISFLKKAEFPEPGPAYFNNLLPRINIRMESQQRDNGLLNIFRLSRIWKYAVTVIPVLLLLFIYKSYFIDNITQKISDSSATFINPENKIITDNSILLDSGFDGIPENEVTNIDKQSLTPDNNTIINERNASIRYENSVEKVELNSYNWLIEDEDINTFLDEESETDIELNILKSDEQEEFLLKLKTENL